MTIELFIYLFTIGSVVSSLITQASKKAVPNISSNIVALVNAIFVGLIGSVVAFNFLDIPLSIDNMIVAALVGICIWVGSMIGYDKVLQTIKQIAGH